MALRVFANAAMLFLEVRDWRHVTFLVLGEVFTGASQDAGHALKQHAVLLFDLRASIYQSRLEPSTQKTGVGLTFNHLLFFGLHDGVEHALGEGVVDGGLDFFEFHLVNHSVLLTRALRCVTVYLRDGSVHACCCRSLI